MKIIKKNVYYCDHCKKKGLAAGHMNKHEKRCTNNPNRECGLCEGIYNIGEIVAEYKSRFKIVTTAIDEIFGHETVEWIGEPITLKEIRDRVDGCPNCTFSIIRQCSFHWQCFGELINGFDWKKEREEWHNSLMQSYTYSI